MPHFKALIFIKIGLKLSLFCKNYKIFHWLGAQPPDPQWPPAGGFRDQTPRQPLIADFWLNT